MDNIDDVFLPENDYQQVNKRLNNPLKRPLYAPMLLAPQPGGYRDLRTFAFAIAFAFALSVQTTDYKRIELPTITEVIQLKCSKLYDYAHSSGVLDACLSDIVNQ